MSLKKLALATAFAAPTLLANCRDVAAASQDQGKKEPLYDVECTLGQRVFKGQSEGGINYMSTYGYQARVRVNFVDGAEIEGLTQNCFQTRKTQGPKQ